MDKLSNEEWKEQMVQSVIVMQDKMEDLSSQVEARMRQILEPLPTVHRMTDFLSFFNSSMAMVECAINRVCMSPLLSIYDSIWANKKSSSRRIQYRTKKHETLQQTVEFLLKSNEEPKTPDCNWCFLAFCDVCNAHRCRYWKLNDTFTKKSHQTKEVNICLRLHYI